MNKKPKKTDDFAALLADVKGRIQTSQTRAVLAVNAELVRLYWDIGRIIDQRQQREGWGAAVIPRLAKELKNELPELKGFSERNIGRMIHFYREYPVPESISQPPVAKLPAPPILPPPVAKLVPASKVPPPVALLPDSLLWTVPWAHHVILMDKMPDIPTRRWYMDQILANGWSGIFSPCKSILKPTLGTARPFPTSPPCSPAPQSDLVQQTLKDPYIFDFLTLTEPFQERELETELVKQLEKFLIELGQGFAFVGRQYRLDVGDEDFSIDLLFYHLRLRAFIAIDLKKGKFKPEYAGKLNFYCNVINDKLRHTTDAATIGLILCQSHDKLQAEYSFAGIDKPIGIATYELTRTLPKSVQSALPTVEEIEAEFQRLEAAPKPKIRPAHKKGGGK